jgi:hypothetical protein
MEDFFCAITKDEIIAGERRLIMLFKTSRAGLLQRSDPE